MLQAGVVLSDYATMVEILKDKCPADYDAIDMPWTKLVGQ
jgi:hypothetical protein